MKRKSLQQIEDHYLQRGYTGHTLRKVLEKDREYRRLLDERKRTLTEKFHVSGKEKRLYVLSTDPDFKILSQCKDLERLQLSKEDRSIIKLVKSQLQDDWRSSLIAALNRLARRYKMSLIQHRPTRVTRTVPPARKR